MDILDEELAAIRRIRMERLTELMRDLEAGRPLGSGRNVSESGSDDTMHPAKAPAGSRSDTPR